MIITPTINPNSGDKLTTLINFLNNEFTHFNKYIKRDITLHYMLFGLYCIYAIIYLTLPSYSLNKKKNKIKKNKTKSRLSGIIYIAIGFCYCLIGVLVKREFQHVKKEWIALKMFDYSTPI